MADDLEKFRSELMGEIEQQIVNQAPAPPSARAAEPVYDISLAELRAAAGAKRAIDRRLNRPSEEWVIKALEGR